MWHIQSQVTELRKLVLLNKEILIALRTNFDKPDVMKELFKRLQNVDSVLQRMTIIGEKTSDTRILLNFATGVILCFRELIQDALSSQLEERIPFLTSSIKVALFKANPTYHINVFILGFPLPRWFSS